MRLTPQSLKRRYLGEHPEGDYGQMECGLYEDRRKAGWGYKTSVVKGENTLD